MAQCCHAVAAFHTNSVNTSRLIDIHVRQKWCLWPNRMGFEAQFWLEMVKLRF